MAPPAGEHADATLQRWRALAAKAAGASVESLRGSTAGGLIVEPFHPPRLGEICQPWRAADRWLVAQRLDHPDPEGANALALADLEGGTDALVLVTAGNPHARGFGLPADRAALAGALTGVELDLIALRLDGDLAALAALAEIAVERRLAAAGLAIDGGFDPLGAASCSGREPALEQLRTAVDLARRGGFAGCPLLADGRPYHETGAGEAAELAAVLATGVAYLRALEATGMALDAARDSIAVLLPVDAELLSGIAKLRAMRRLWARVEDLCRLDSRPLRLHAETSWRCMTRRDPHTNALRGALGAVAAGVGGADTVTVLPMTLAAGLPDADARRLARNTGRVLIDEAQLARVDDGAGGSGALEAMTDALCEQSWELFQRVEGGEGLPTGAAALRACIEDDAARRSADLATLRRGIVGTSLYPSLAATGVPCLAVTPLAEAPAGAGALRRRRDAEPFETLRDRGEAAGRPRVFLAGLGAAAGYAPPASAAANLLAAAGLAATEPQPVGPAAADAAGPDLAGIAAAFRASGARCACLCGSEEACRELGETVAGALRAAGAAAVAMTSRDEDWRKKGIDILVHDCCPALQTLASMLEKAIPLPG